jgi:DNA-binding response OmpR family regulator
VDRILVVDDEKSIVFALRHYFVQQGFLVDCALTAEEALEHLASHHYAVTIIDIELRGSNDSIDGLNLAEFVRRHAPATVVIILSAVESTEAESRARAVGVHSFVHKPAPLSQIADVAVGLMRATALGH